MSPHGREQPRKPSPAPIDASAAARSLRSFHDRLFAAYGPQRWWPAKTPLEVIVGAYLTQNTSWSAVERSIANLAAHGVIDLPGLRAISEDDLRLLIRPSGYMARKAAAIKTFVAFLDREYSGSLDALAAQPAARARGAVAGALWGRRGDGRRDPGLRSWPPRDRGR